MPLLLCGCQSFIKESYLLTYFTSSQHVSVPVTFLVLCSSGLSFVIDFCTAVYCISQFRDLELVSQEHARQLRLRRHCHVVGRVCRR